ncbi:MAG: hypothetical protein IIA83_08440 [Thaumarchaeota archaeon]|nr:hypothetical protein [Nitrososphaerota archaeon]
MNDEEKLEKYIEFENSLTIYDDNKVLSELEKLKKEGNQRIEELEKAQKETMNRLDEMSSVLTTQLNSDLDEKKEMNERDLMFFAKIVRIKMKTDPEYSKEMKKILLKKGFSEEMNKKINEI